MIQRLRAGTTAREFKTLKRQQLLEVQRLYRCYWAHGCAASPAFEYVDEFERLLELMIEAQSVKKWGR